MKTLLSKKWLIILVIAVLLGLLAAFIISKPANGPEDTTPLSERVQIDMWIGANNLNQYGDSADTVYAGGTPLFNEFTGERTDRYDYILRTHPDKPWESY